jgi:hypothetical protein
LCESRLGHHLPLLRSFISSSYPPGKFWDNTSIRSSLPSCKSVLIHCSSIVLSFDSILSEIITALHKNTLDNRIFLSFVGLSLSFQLPFFEFFSFCHFVNSLLLFLFVSLFQLQSKVLGIIFFSYSRVFIPLQHFIVYLLHNIFHIYSFAGSVLLISLVT